MHNSLAPPPHSLTAPPAFDVFERDPPSFGPTPYFDSAHVKRPESKKVKDDIFQEHSVLDRLNIFNFDVALKVSFMGGLVQVEG